MTKLDAEDWDDVWGRHLESYRDVTPRTGIAIHSLFGSVDNALEIACGSGRDANYLFKKGVSVSAIDYAKDTIEKLQNKLPEEMDLQSQDAFALTYEDQSFDLSFHNGFYVLFDNDEDVKKLIREQARITNKKMVVIEHNSRNERLVNKFKQKSESDPIYNIRFYDPDELAGLIKQAGLEYQSIRILKFGGWPDKLYALPNKFKWLNIFHVPVYWLVPHLYQLVPWHSVERCMVVVDMK